MPIQAAIIGLNKIGSSLGLAFAQHPEVLTCVGYDEEPKVAREAVKIGAITKAFLALHRCVGEAQVIILACPLDEVQDNLALIAAHAPKNAVVIDCSPIKTEVTQWAQEILPGNMYFTGWLPALNPQHVHDPGVGIEAARADLFENSYIGITDPPGTPEDVLTLSSDLVTLLGAKPFFIDSVEADGLIAMGQELPRAAALALLLAAVDSSGWFEARKLAGEDFAKATQPILNLPEREELGLSMLLNRENLTRLIDDLVGALMRLRGRLEDGDADALKEDLGHALHQRVLWLEQRRLMNWQAPGEEDEPVERPSLLGGWLGSCFKRGKDSGDQD